MPSPDFINTKEKLAEIIRVDHAGEYGAKRIYQGQLKHCQNRKDHNLIKDMLLHEQVHLDYFNDQLIQRKIRPTFLMPLWHHLGYAVGAISSLVGPKMAMLVTEAVECVIEGHYERQLDYLKDNDREQELFDNIKHFQDEEVNHKNIALKHGSSSVNCSREVSFIIKTACTIAINLSKKI